MQKILDGDVLIAIYVKRFRNGINPITTSQQPLQILLQKRNAGDQTLPHMHQAQKRITSTLQECIVVTKGKILVDLFSADTKGKKIASVVLSNHEMILFVSGGHAVYFLENTELIEIKNGPFINDKMLIE